MRPILRGLGTVAARGIELLGLVQIAKWIGRLLGWGEHIEFIAHHIRDLGRVGIVIDSLLDPPAVPGLAIVAVGVVLILLDVRRKRVEWKVIMGPLYLAIFLSVLTAIAWIWYFANHNRGPIAWEFDGVSPVAYSRLNNNPLWADGFNIRGTNRSNEPLTIVAAFIQIDNTKQKFPLNIELASPFSRGPVSSERVIIPPGVKFILTKSLPQREPTRGPGFYASVFIAEFVPFTFVFQSDGSNEEFVKQFDKDEIIKLMQRAEGSMQPPPATTLSVAPVPVTSNPSPAASYLPADRERMNEALVKIHGIITTKLMSAANPLRGKLQRLEDGLSKDDYATALIQLKQYDSEIETGEKEMEAVFREKDYAYLNDDLRKIVPSSGYGRGFQQQLGEFIAAVQAILEVAPQPSGRLQGIVYHLSLRLQPTVMAYTEWAKQTIKIIEDKQKELRQR